MIRVIVDLVPYGDEDRARSIGELILANTGSLGDGVSEYYAVYRNDREEVERKRVHHQRSLGFWELIRKIIDAKECNADPEMFIKLEERMRYVRPKTSDQGAGQ